MRIFFDTEFMEDGETIKPLSVGMVDETGTYGLYVVVSDADRTQANPWVQENVLPNLDTVDLDADCFHLPHAECGRQIAHWVSVIAGDHPEFWADYCSYDWVVLCQLFGMMIDLPDGWPMFCHDIQQEADRLGVSDLPEGDNDHNAYQDALTTRARWMRLVERAP